MTCDVLTEAFVAGFKREQVARETVRSGTPAELIEGTQRQGAAEPRPKRQPRKTQD
jgi:hypothetical protein